MATIFPFLDRWHEPKDIGKKVEAATLHDILQFKKALDFMSKDFTFGHDYGSCATRKQCVKHAVRVYRRLLKFTPDQQMMNFDVIGALAYEEDGELDEDRAIALLRMFYPDKDDLLPMLAFVQACDKVYKQMRFLRASLNNSTKIDGVLEDIFDAFFYFSLAIALSKSLSVPWCVWNPADSSNVLLIVLARSACLRVQSMAHSGVPEYLDCVFCLCLWIFGGQGKFFVGRRLEFT